MRDITKAKIAIKTAFLKQSPEYNGFQNTEAGGYVKQSQTQRCTLYPLTGFIYDRKYNFTVIDSPGLSDTRGIGQDDINMNNILVSDGDTIVACVN